MSRSPAANKQAEAKLQEADQQMKEADKLTTKTLTRWKPDWDSAAVVYEKAANNYKNAKAYEQAKNAFQKASNAFYQMNILFTAAKHLDNAASMAKEQKQLEQATQLYEKASMVYRENGSGFNAADNLAKAAKLIEPVNVDKAMDYLKQACELFELEDKEHYSGETFKIAISLFLKNKKYGETIELLRNQSRVFKKLNQPHDLNKCYLSMIVIYLHCEDTVAANNLYTEFLDVPGFSQSQEGSTAAELLSAYDSGNPDALKTVINKQIFNFLDNQVTKIARALTLSDGLVPKNSIGSVSAPPPTTTTTTTSTASAPPQEEEEDGLL
eukprot:Phypoly_transcript_06497.p1 GENE.Phypoly_transcript_06497~~Phypoly_transcript_06497.p1  ORF type:complete len:326 (+),score=69.88 Phypoly_transcript_06497:33-1010(+)